MAKKVDFAEQALLETLLELRNSSKEFREAVRVTTLRKMLTVIAASSQEYVELLISVSEAVEFDASEIGVPEARAAHRKLVAVIARFQNSTVGGHYGC